MAFQVSLQSIPVLRGIALESCKLNGSLVPLRTQRVVIATGAETKGVFECLNDQRLRDARPYSAVSAAGSSC